MLFDTRVESNSMYVIAPWLSGSYDICELCVDLKQNWT